MIYYLWAAIVSLGLAAGATIAVVILITLQNKKENNSKKNISQEEVQK